MALSQRQRWTVIGGALAVTVALVIGSGNGPEDGVVEPETRPVPQAGVATEPGKAAGPAETAPGLRAGRGDPGGGPGEIRDLFAQQTWHVAPPPAAAGPPQLPPLPFEYMGRLIDGGRVTVYLEDEEERNLAVRQGDVIDGTYRVKRITPAAVTFVYIPMNKQQVLEIGSAN